MARVVGATVVKQPKGNQNTAADIDLPCAASARWPWRELGAIRLKHGVHQSIKLLRKWVGMAVLLEIQQVNTVAVLHSDGACRN